MTPATDRPNLILFFPDELRADALGCYGNPVCKTPNFDRLAENGVRFVNCHVQFSVCGASRCSMLTGWPTSMRGHRSLFYMLRPDEPNMFRYLRQAGYDVYWFGKNDALAADSFPDSVSMWKGDGHVLTPEILQIILTGGVTPDATTMLYSSLPEGHDLGDRANVDAAIDVLNRPPSDRPFCIFLPLFEPHPPYFAPAPYHEMYRGADLPALVPPGLPGRPSHHAAIRQAYGLAGVSDVQLRELRSVYYGKVSYSDALLGLLMDALEKTGHIRDTALILASDHGDYAGDYGLVEKWPSGLEDCLTHVPLIVSAPGCVRGIVSREIVELFDIMPTCLELAGTAAAHTHFARSLMPQLKGRPGDPDRAAFSEGGYNSYEPQAFEPVGQGPYKAKTRLQNEQPKTVSRVASIRTQTHKLIARPGGQSELYDCIADPQQTRNLIDEPGFSEFKQSLLRRLLDWYIDTTGVPPKDKDARGLPPFPPEIVISTA